MSGEDRLKSFAESYARQRGFHFGEGAENDIRTMARQAVQQFEFKFSDETKRARMEESFLRMSEQQFVFFIDAMILAREEVYDEARMRQNLLGEDTYRKARDWICPLWPICG